MIPNLSDYLDVIDHVQTLRPSGRVTQVIGLTVEAVGLDCQIGEVCEIRGRSATTVLSEVVGFKNKNTLLMPLDEMSGIQPDCEVHPMGSVFRAPVGFELMGRVLDGLGQPIDDMGPL
ncbi:MAG: hypothetical protein LWX83_13555, partial [Anaerolineae bacterium]|nr:hypothetical protein [Anaerolineae bacterium]